MKGPGGGTGAFTNQEDEAYDGFEKKLTAKVDWPVVVLSILLFAIMTWWITDLAGRIAGAS